MSTPTPTTETSPRVAPWQSKQTVSVLGAGALAGIAQFQLPDAAPWTAHVALALATVLAAVIYCWFESRRDLALIDADLRRDLARIAAGQPIATSAATDAATTLDPGATEAPAP